MSMEIKYLFPCTTTVLLVSNPIQCNMHYDNILLIEVTRIVHGFWRIYSGSIDAATWGPEKAFRFLKHILITNSYTFYHQSIQNYEKIRLPNYVALGQ